MSYILCITNITYEIVVMKHNFINNIILLKDYDLLREDVNKNENVRHGRLCPVQ